MTLVDIAVHRLYSQRLNKTTFKRPGDVVAWMGAIQAQDYAGAKWSLGLRLAKATEAGIEQAIDDKKVLRTWAMRGTLHFVAPADIRWMLELLAPRIIANNARRYKELELDGRTFARSTDIIAKALQENKQLDRPALVAILEKKGISAAGQRTPYLLQRAALERIIFQGVMRSNNPTYLLMDEWISKTKSLKRDQALAELALRYFTSRGPATLQDFIWWSGLSAVDASVALASIKSKLVHETIEEQTYWLLRSMPKTTKNSSAVYLLPGFDEYLLSYQDRSASMDVKPLRTLTPTNGMLPPTIVMNGRVEGTLRRTLKKGAAVIEAKPFTELSAVQEQALNAAALRYGEYLEMPVEME